VVGGDKGPVDAEARLGRDEGGEEQGGEEKRAAPGAAGDSRDEAAEGGSQAGEPAQDSSIPLIRQVLPSFSRNTFSVASIFLPLFLYFSLNFP